ncbi:MAG: DUF1552 domain-containing protein [Acidobacteria bacterium]|nr:DUF1552 domain-containing protein [Acidobacteriota bacterium]
MMIFKKAIPRRTFLRGAGTVLALPLLDSMIPALTAAGSTAAKPVLRLGYVYMPIGRIMDKWLPVTEGASYETTPTLEPLAPFRDQSLLLSGLNIKAADPWPGERGGTHARPAAAYLTGVHPAPNKSLGISVDQVVAKETGKHTQLASLELGLDPAEFAGGNEADYSGYYRSTIAWGGPLTPLPTENNPRKVFERLFGDTDSTDPAELLRRIKRQSSILDSVTRRAARMMRAVGSSDRYKLTEYLDAIRDIERRIQVAEKSASAGEQTSAQDPSAMERPAGIPKTYAEHAKLIFDLMLLAYQTDLTRVITFMMGHEGTNRTYREIGAHDGHHSLSHHKNIAESIAMVEQIDRYQSEMIAYFLEKMRSTSEGDGSLLDHSMIICGSALSDGNLHLHNDVPTLLVGGGVGQLKGGRHIRYPGLPFSNLHLAVLDMFGVSEKGYLSKGSDATGKLEGLSA